VTLFGKTRRKLLGWLFTHPDESFYVRELVRILDASPGALSRELDELTAAGILRRTARGRATFYQVARDSPIFEELQGIFLKTAGLTGELRRALEPLSPRIDLALLHGSAARGALRSGSDIDLVIVGAISFGEVVTALSPAQARLGREINPIVYPKAEFRRRIRSGDHFLTSILQEPHLFVLGGENELGRLVPKRMAASSPNLVARGRRPARRRRTRPRR
jgi:predicted nucleotidyltransferase